MDELVKRLREADEKSMCGECGLNLHTGATKKGVLFAEAADAIEELATNYDAATDIMKHQTEYIEELEAKLPRWIPATKRLPSDFVSVQAHIVGAEPLPTVREAYVIGGKWFFPALKEFLPVDMWKRFDEPPKEDKP